MNFPYTEVEEYVGFRRIRRMLPWIPIAIFNPNDPKKIIFPLGLVDSGSDVTIIDREIGIYLDYKIEEGRKDIIRGVGGGKTEGYFHESGLIINDPGRKEKPIKIFDDVFFTVNPFPSTNPQQTAIFGTIGLFRHTVITFDFPNVISIQNKTNG